jgi:cyd operon protein YbgT
MWRRVTVAEIRATGPPGVLTVVPGRGPAGRARDPINFDRSKAMWYFAWILGVLLALAFGIINVMWYESEQCLGDPEDDRRAA